MKSNFVEISEWDVIERGWYPERNRLYESIFSLGNEHMGLRGFFEEKYTGDTLKGTYTAGLYYLDKTRVGWWKNGYPEFFAKVLNNTNWAGMDIILNGRELDLNSGQYAIEGFVRRLDMKNAAYTRNFTVCDKVGRKTGFEFKRFLSMEDKSIACVSVKVTTLNYCGKIVIKPYLDGNVKNEDANYDEIFWNRISELSEPYPAVTMETKKTNFRQTCAMKCICTVNGEQVLPKVSLTKEKYSEQEFEVRTNQAKSIELVKIVCLCTSIDICKEKLESTCLLNLKEAAMIGAEGLFNRHGKTMEKIWKSCDIQIEGDPMAQQGIRYSVLELMLTYSGADARLNIGPKVLIELSRFWANRVTYNKKKDCYMILGVTGPNEYENNVNNNFHTNTVAAWTLEYTLQCLKEFGTENMPDNNEIILWREIAAKMYFPYVKELEVFEQNDLYLDKELLPVDTIPESERPINQHWSWDKVLRSCFIKQADVIQSLYFFPQKYSIEEQRRNFDFYEPMTVHESSLSSSIYSVVASRIGYTKKAYELFLRTSRLDLENVNNDTCDGLHITSMGATWAAVIQGFAGIDTVDGSLVINPRLPEHWKNLGFNMNYRGAQISIKIDTRKIELRAQGNNIHLAVNGRKYSLEVGKSLTINLGEKDYYDAKVQHRDI